MREATLLAILCAFGVTTALGACGDEEEPTTPMTGGTTATTGTTMTSGGGEGGMGHGGMGHGGSAGAGQGGAGQGGAGGGGSGPINGCTDADFQPPANPANVVITSTGLLYAPQCLLIQANTPVTFSSNFAAHPLRAGAVDADVVTPDPSSPITDQDTGNSATFIFATPGDHGYYCLYHYERGMYGAIRVQ